MVGISIDVAPGSTIGDQLHRPAFPVLQLELPDQYFNRAHHGESRVRCPARRDLMATGKAAEQDNSGGVQLRYLFGGTVLPNLPIPVLVLPEDPPVRLSTV